MSKQENKDEDKTKLQDAIEAALKAAASEREKKESLKETVIGVLSLIFALVVLFGSGAGLIANFSHKIIRSEPTSGGMDTNTWTAIQQQLAAQLNEFQALIVTNNPPHENQLAAQLAASTIQISNLTARVSSLEDAIQSSPEKAIAIPLMRKDIDIVQKGQADLEGQIDHLFTFNVTFFGLIATMALAVVGMALTLFFKKHSPPPKDDD